MRINPYTLTRPAPITETRVFTDPANAEMPLSLTFSAAGGFNAILEIGKKGSDLIRDFVTGTFTPPDKEGQPPVVKEPPTPLVIPGFGKFVPSESLCHIIAQLMYLQVPFTGESPYDFAEWCIISELLPSAFGQISQWSDALLTKATVASKNAVGASTAV